MGGLEKMETGEAGMERATDWNQIPLLLTISDLREKFGLSRQQSYVLAHVIGLKMGKRLVIPKRSLQRWMDEKLQQQAM